MTGEPTTTVRSRLFDFQGRMLDILHAGGPPEELLRQLREAAAGTEMEDYVGTFDLRMVQVASELVRKWGGK